MAEPLHTQECGSRCRTRCERLLSWTDVAPQRIAVGVSHNDRKDILRSRLDSMGHPEVVVDTANKLQGLEFDIVIAWHPPLIEVVEFKKEIPPCQLV